MIDDRYQHQPFLIRCYRWWRWMPLAYALAAIAVCRWIASGAELPDGEEESEFPPMGYLDVARLLWGFQVGHIQVERMKWRFDVDDIFRSWST